MKTKTTTMIALTAILATALVFPNIGPVEAFEIPKFTKIAMTADTTDDLKPKAYGEKTKKATCSENPCFEQSDITPQGVKKQIVKDMKKATELQKAEAFMKIYYRLGA